MLRGLRVNRLSPTPTRPARAIRAYAAFGGGRGARVGRGIWGGNCLARAWGREIVVASRRPRCRLASRSPELGAVFWSNGTPPALIGG